MRCLSLSVRKSGSRVPVARSSLSPACTCQNSKRSSERRTSNSTPGTAHGSVEGFYATRTAWSSLFVFSCHLCTIQTAKKSQLTPAESAWSWLIPQKVAEEIPHDVAAPPDSPLPAPSPPTCCPAACLPRRLVRYLQLMSAQNTCTPSNNITSCIRAENGCSSRALSPLAHGPFQLKPQLAPCLFSTRISLSFIFLRLSKK